MTDDHKSIYWTRLDHDSWSIHMAATDQGLCYVGSQDRPFEEMDAWVAARYPGWLLKQDEAIIEPYRHELIEYFQGKRLRFEAAVDFKGTPFQTEVWSALIDIPYGQRLTYTDVANRIGRPTAIRAVAAAIGANPLLIRIPCHRVIGKSGALTGYRGGLDMKTRLLELERTTRPSQHTPYGYP